MGGSLSLDTNTRGVLNLLDCSMAYRITTPLESLLYEDYPNGVSRMGLDLYHRTCAYPPCYLVGTPQLRLAKLDELMFY